MRQLLRSLGLGAVRVGSVDDYQGQEETIIIISTVLASYGDRSSLGRLASPHSLMSSPQRFNVAITRARALLVVARERRGSTHHSLLVVEPLRWGEGGRPERADRRPVVARAAPVRGRERLLSRLPTGRRFTLSRCEQASENTMAQLADHVANSVLGSGNAVAMFPTLAGEATYDGAYDESDDQPWRVML